MGTCLLACCLALFCTSALGQQSSPPSQSRQDAQRRDQVMGFSHDSTTHHFHLLKDGGEIVVTANDPKDTTSVQQIRMRLGHIVKMFSNGDFSAPMMIHDTNASGVATMIRLKADIHYTLAEIRIETAARKPQTRCTHSCSLKSWTTRPEMLPQLRARGELGLWTKNHYFG
jgi:hypothetical protein